MRTSRMLLRLLLLVGSLILLLDAHHRGLATYSAECGYYGSGTPENCPSPCQLTYPTWPSEPPPGPYYINGNQEWCTGDSGLDCTSATGVSSATTPQISSACGCGDTGNWCEDDANCCTDLFCVEHACATCIPDGYDGCATNADCCDDSPCTCYGYCGCGGAGDDCCTNADCCDGYVCNTDDNICQSSGGGGGGGGCTSNDDCSPDKCCDIPTGDCRNCSDVVGGPQSLDRMSPPSRLGSATAGGGSNGGATPPTSSGKSQTPQNRSLRQPGGPTDQARK
jgi:hypothetical protein